MYFTFQAIIVLTVSILCTQREWLG